LEAEKAEEITVLDVRGLTLIADYFILCTGNSTTHIEAIAEGVRETMKESAHLRSKPEGVKESNWIVLDYGDAVVHIFNDERRKFYDLERLWSDAPKVQAAAAAET
jgi:ribosome-associated protein